MLGDFITRILVLLLGYAYPAFECFKCVEKNRINIDELRFWCQYWIIVALLTVCERIGDTFMSWLPMYGEVKLAFFIYLWYPKTKGTDYIYQALLRPYVANNETEIDRKLQDLKARAWDFAIYYWQNCTTLTQTTFFQVLQYFVAKSGKSSHSSNHQKGNQYEPSAPPAPATDEPPSTTKWPPRPPPMPSFMIKRDVSETPEPDRVQVNLYSQTEAVRAAEANGSTKADVNDKLHRARMRFRR